MPAKKVSKKTTSGHKTPPRSRKRHRSSDSKKSGSSKKKATTKPKSFFPIKTIHDMMQEKASGFEVKEEAAVFVCGIMEYLAAELLEISINVGRNQLRDPNSTTVVLKASDVDTAIQKDAELSQLMEKVRAHAGG